MLKNAYLGAKIGFDTAANELLFGFLLADLNTAGDMRVPGVPFHLFSFTVYTYISCSPLRFSFRSDAVSLSLRGEPPLPSDLEDNAALASLRFENEPSKVCSFG